MSAGQAPREPAEPAPDPAAPLCRACGFPLVSGDAPCPKCQWSPTHERTRAREFWWALAIFAALFFAVAAVVYVMASRMEVH